MSDPLNTIASNSRSSTFIKTTNNFLNQGGLITYNTINHSQYENNINRGVNSGGTINININDVGVLAKTLNIPVEEALQMTFAHELGHYAYATDDARSSAKTPIEREQYCYTREGEAAAFEFTIAQEARAAGLAFGVAGVNGTPDLYYNYLQRPVRLLRCLAQMQMLSPQA